MPSIPQSLLWISLVVLWLFVLVPMLISKRDAVRRTSDVALASRVLNGGAGARLLKRSGPASGHRSDPDWTPEEDSADDELDDDTDQIHAEADEDRDTEEQPARPVVMRFAVAEETEPDYLDVDVVEDSAALPAGVSAVVPEAIGEAVVPEAIGEEADEADEDEDEDEHDDELADLAHLADRYEYIEDSSGLEPEDEDDANTNAFVAARSRRRRFDPTHAAAISAKKYAARRRVLMVMAVILVGTATTAFEITPTAWWVCGGATAVTLLYLGYLRRQTRIEEKVRRRRTQRMARARLGVENARDREYDVVPSRLRRPGAVVLEIDDEDPMFEHLEYAIPQQNYGWSRELPRAVGQ
ncbi:membrane protein [Mycobacterium rhizamassiliense]|uniref:Membrane protein n=1 Tax=Mycobacterium rhizamassiliense TaxID=1841860 RepID=A0A2U3NUR6_9MYCO|nr:gephyrin-like molybdotransferase receptor GlpR [Mycobacterium rhizamassiliense]SPM35249.1 membrane protein [Mycobacterium rhizamassiliense]